MSQIYRFDSSLPEAGFKILLEEGFKLSSIMISGVNAEKIEFNLGVYDREAEKEVFVLDEKSTFEPKGMKMVNDDSIFNKKFNVKTDLQVNYCKVKLYRMAMKDKPIPELGIAYLVFNGSQVQEVP